MPTFVSCCDNDQFQKLHGVIVVWLVYLLQLILVHAASWWIRFSKLHQLLPISGVSVPNLKNESAAIASVLVAEYPSARGGQRALYEPSTCGGWITLVSALVVTGCKTGVWGVMEKSTSPGYLLSAVSKLSSLLILPDLSGIVIRITAQSSRRMSLSGPCSVARLGGRSVMPVSLSSIVHTNLQNVETNFKSFSNMLLL